MIIEERWSLGFGLNRVWNSHCSSGFPGSQCVTQDGLKLTVVLLPLSPLHCNYRHEPHVHLLFVVLRQCCSVCQASSNSRHATYLTIEWILMGLITAHSCVLEPVAQPVWASVPSCWVFQCPLRDLVRSITKWGAHVQSVLPNVSLLKTLLFLIRPPLVNYG